MSTSQTPADWAAMTSLAVGIYAACSAVFFLLVDVDFDALRTDAAVTVAALLLLLSAPRPEASR